MQLEKTLLLAAPPEQVWALLLDAKVMGACVPGMQSIEVVSATEYLALMQVKLAFVNTKFKIRTTIAEQRAPHYLRSVGTGDDSAAASSFKQTSEIFLAPVEGATPATQMRMALKVDLLGRLGSLGLNVMKTKADRLWDEFGVAFAARLAQSQAEAAQVQNQEPAAAGVSAVVAPARFGWLARWRESWRAFWRRVFG